MCVYLLSYCAKCLPPFFNASKRKNKIHNYELPIPFYILYSNLNPTQLPQKGKKTCFIPSGNVKIE